MKKLNKNQYKFFKEAMLYFGDNSNDVRLKEINEFATEYNLIVPTSALKKYCHEQGQTRGHYNLLLSGVVPDKKVEIINSDDFRSNSSDIITDNSVYADVVEPKIQKRFDPTGMQRLSFRNPVYAVFNSNGNVISIRTSIKGAFEDRILSLHDQGNKSIEDVREELEYIGSSYIKSSNSQLYCEIVVHELK